MVYELILTDRCNRNCSFCWVPRESYTASVEEVQTFISEVKRLELNKTTSFKISLFGGEPLLNLVGIQLVHNAFKDVNRCQLSITSNGDLAGSVLAQLAKLPKLHWHLTAYDFQTDPTKYTSIVKALPRATVQFTFTEEDISQIPDFRSFAKDVVRAQYKIAFSHSPKSWMHISAADLHAQVKQAMAVELEDILENPDLPVQSLLADHYLRLLLSSVAKMAVGCTLSPSTCLDAPKMCFFKGRFVGKCLRLKEKVEQELASLEFEKCSTCDYNLVCTKSCIAEAASGIVDEKLCAIQRACFDAIAEFASGHQHDLAWRDKVLKHYMRLGHHNG